MTDDPTVDPERPTPEKAPRTPLISDRSTDDSDEGWGESGGTGGFSDDWYREQRPPHW